jgi:hypothetical protein
MTVDANEDYMDREDEGYISLVLVAVRYVGSSANKNDPSSVNQGRYPARRTFRQGTWYFGLVPESTPDGDSSVGVAWFERAGDWEVEYDPIEVASLMLDKNYLPPNVFGDSPNPRVRERVIDSLGLEDEVEAGQTYEEQLAELAGVDEEEATVGAELSRSEELLQEYDRGTLKEAAKEVREDADDFSLQGVSTEEMADYLAEQDGDEVEAALQEA